MSGLHVLFNCTINLLQCLLSSCRGIRFVSRHRQQRIKAIAQHLKEQQYDIVFLEEVSVLFLFVM